MAKQNVMKIYVVSRFFFKFWKIPSTSVHTFMYRSIHSFHIKFNVKHTYWSFKVQCYSYTYIHVLHAKQTDWHMTTKNFR